MLLTAVTLLLVGLAAVVLGLLTDNPDFHEITSWSFLTLLALAALTVIAHVFINIDSEGGGLGEPDTQ